MKPTPEQLRNALKIRLAQLEFWEFCLFYDFDFFDKRPFLKTVADAFQQVYEGKIKTLSVSMPPRAGKCVSLDMEIYTPLGTKKIKDILIGEELFSYSNGNLILEKVVAKEYSKKPQIKIKYITGEEIIISPEHKLLTFDGYKEAQFITEQDFLIGFSSDIEYENKIDENLLRFLTYMIFEGHCKKSNSSFTSIEQYLIDDFIRVCTNLNIRCDIRDKQGTEAKSIILRGNGINHNKKEFSHPSNKILFEYDLLGHLCYTKRLPKIFYTLCKKQRWLFIELMFKTDGWFDKKTAAITLANKDLIMDIKFLCNTLGLKTSTTEKYSKQFNSKSWTLSFGRSQVEKIINNCDLGRKQEAANKLLNKKGYSFLEVYPHKIGHDFTPKEQRILNIGSDNKKNITKDKFDRLLKLKPELEKYLMNDFYYVKIKSIEKSDEIIDMVDIETTGGNNFVVNGIVSHNSYITSLFAAWNLGNRPTESVMRNTCTSTLYDKFSYDTRNIVKSEKFTNVFPNSRISPNRQNIGGWNMEASKQVGYFGAGVGGTIIGFGASGVAITDDLYKSMGDALSQKTNEGVDMWLDSAHNSRLEKNCPQIDIGTRWSLRDVIGKKIEAEKYDLSIIVPALVNDKSFCEEVKSTEEYIQIRQDLINANSIEIWLAEYMQEPAEVAGLLFRKSDIKRFTMDEFTKETTKVNEKGETVSIVECTYGYIDPAEGGGDDLAGIWAKIIKGKAFITDVIFTVDDVEVSTVNCAKIINTNETQYCRIEKNGLGSGFIRDMKRLVSPEKIFDSNNATHKGTRIWNESGFIHKNFYFLSEKEYTPGSDYDKFMRNLFTYMKIGDNQKDGAPDATAGLSRMIQSFPSKELFR